MNLSVGIVGLPNVGKSTLFNALLGRQIASTENYPFCTIEPNVGIVEVPDENLAQIAAIARPERVVSAVIKFIDIAGLVKGAAEGGGLGNQFLAHIRECQLICHVLREFTDPNVASAGSIDPQEDYQTVQTELLLKDLETLEKVQARLRKTRQPAEKKAQAALEAAVEKLLPSLQASKPASEVDLTEKERGAARELFLLTAKPELIVINVNELALRSDLLPAKGDPTLQSGAVPTASEAIPICAKLEQELTELPKEERQEYLESLGLQESALSQLIRKAYQKLNLISFYTTTGGQEVRAWTITKGTLAPQAAGVIHSDFEKGFIKAAVVSLENFLEHSGWAGAREAGRLRLEGRGYVIQPNEVVEFRFTCAPRIPIVP